MRGLRRLSDPFGPLGPKRTNRLILAVFLSTVCAWIFVSSHGFQLNGDFSPIGGILTYSQLQTPHDNVFRYLDEQKNVTDRYASLVDENDHLQLLDYDRDHIKYIYPEVIDSVYNNTNFDEVDWSKFAYVLYATSSAHMCNAMMILAELRNAGTRAELVMLVNREFLDNETNPDEYEMLTKYQATYNVTLKPTELVQKGGDSVNIWKSSFTKLLVFNQTEYDRIIYMDSDAILLKSHLDELFFLPPCQLAVPPAYWHMHDRFEKQEIKDRFLPERYGFKPLTTAQRKRKVDTWIDENIRPFMDSEKHKLPTSNKPQGEWEQEQAFYERRVNNKNFHTNLYNELPNYPAFDIFKLTNIMMVIQPTPELFARVQYQLDHKGKDEFDMELTEKMFDLPTMIDNQQNASLLAQPHIPFDTRLDESPEVLLIPYQRYATLSQQFNQKDTHWWWMADAYEQVFAHHHRPTSNGKPAYYEIDSNEHPYDTVFEQVKYFHFSDAPIPKPWWKQHKDRDYMAFRRRCPEHPDFHTDGVVKPKNKVDDCSGGEHWDDVYALFRRTRWEVCGLDLLDTKENTYYEVIN